MTQHSQNGEGVEVIQSDRTFIASVLRLIGGYEIQSSVIESGQHDDGDIVQATARYRQSLARDPATADVGRGQGCDVPPPGWWCSRAPGHEGPCAACPIGTLDVILDWYRGLKETARQSISLHDLHAMAKCLAALSRAAPSSGMKKPVREYENTVANVIKGAAPSSGHAMAEGERTDGQLKDAVSELLSHRGERPYRVLRGGQELWETWVPAFRTALRYLPATTPPTTNDAIPSGWKLVPETNTPEMCEAYEDLYLTYGDGPPVEAVWSAMLSAAPSAPVTEAGEGA